MKQAWTNATILLLLALLATTGHFQELDAAINPDTVQQPPDAPPGGAGAADADPDAGTIIPPKEPTAPVVPSPSPSPSTAPAAASPSPSPQPSPKPTTPVVPTVTGTAPQTGTVPGTPVGPTPTAPGGTAATAPGNSTPTAGAATAVTPPVPGAATTTPPVTPVTSVTTPVPGAVPGAAAGVPVTPPVAGAAPGAAAVPGAAAAAAGVPVTSPAAGADAVQPGVQPLEPAAATPPGSVPLGPGGVPLGVYVPMYPAANASTNSSTPENSTAIEGISPEDSGTKLVNALLGALGASKVKRSSSSNPIAALDNNNRTGSSSSRSTRRRWQRRRRSSSSSLPGSALSGSSGVKLSFQDLRSSEKLSDGLLTTADGSSFCVASKEMFATTPAANPAAGGSKLSFASTDFASSTAAAAAADLHDPACDDEAVDRSKYCNTPKPGGGSSTTQGAGASNSTTTPKALKFMDAGTTAAAVTPVGPDGLMGMPDGSLPPTNNASALTCTQGFTKMGSAPRSLAVVLIKWARQYYKTREECCMEASNSGSDCDCKWNGYTYDNLPAPSAYSRMFTDECDGKPSINRAYYDMSGGMVTFHGKARVPTPAAVMAVRAKRTGHYVRQDAPVPLNTLPPTVTESSYLDPDGVDVYGWVVLNQMREGGDGSCMDWCGEGIKAMGINSSEYNHIMCMALYSQSSTICDSCDASKTACAGTCPASSGISTGCGCGTCSFAWGGQSSCNRAAEPGVRTGLNVPTTTYPDREPPLVPGMRPRSFIKITRGNKVYMSHELGHNMGLTHTGALRCATTGNVVNRQPEGCTPDWYGDQTSFMGSGSDLQMPNAMKYRVRWLPRGTLKTHTAGADVRYILSAATSRRPSWQDGTTAGEVRWFDATTDTLAVRVPLTFPSKEVAGVGGFKCPCPACPQCTAQTCSASGATTSCCTDPSCADSNFSFFYVELHQPYANDNTPDYKGIAIRLMGDLSTCTSTRAVATHLDGEGKPQYLLNNPDPTGAAVGSRFEDPLRRVTVIFEEWSGSQATIRVIG